jgi:hypothetical protein
MRKSILVTIVSILAVGAVALTAPATAKDNRSHTNNSSGKTTSSTVGTGQATSDSAVAAKKTGKGGTKTPLLRYKFDAPTISGY